MQVIAEQQRKRLAQAELAHRTLTMPKVLAEDKGHMMLALNADSDAQSLPGGPGLPGPAVSPPPPLPHPQVQALQHGKAFDAFLLLPPAEMAKATWCWL